MAINNIWLFYATFFSTLLSFSLGGPILNEQGVQVGVVSWGNGCGLKGFPGVYARISHSKQWLQESICTLSDSPPDYCNDIVLPDNSGNSSSQGGGSSLSSWWDWMSSLFFN